MTNKGKTLKVGLFGKLGGPVA